MDETDILILPRANDEMSRLSRAERLEDELRRKQQEAHQLWRALLFRQQIIWPVRDRSPCTVIMVSLPIFIQRSLHHEIASRLGQRRNLPPRRTRL